MPYCPICRKRLDAKECPDDHVALVDELPYQTVDGNNATWVEIESVGTDDEARLIQGFLQEEGIDCQIESLRFDPMPANLGAMGEIRIYVPAEAEAAAQQLLRERTSELAGIAADAVITDEGPADIDENAPVAEEE